MRDLTFCSETMPMPDLTRQSFASRSVFIATVTLAVTLLVCTAFLGAVFYSFVSQENRDRDRFAKSVSNTQPVDQNGADSK